MQWFEDEQTEAWNFTSDNSEQMDGLASLERTAVKIMHILPPASMEKKLVDLLEKMELTEYMFFDSRQPLDSTNSKLKSDNQVMLMVEVPLESCMPLKQKLNEFSEEKHPVRVFTSDVEIMRPIQLG